MKAILLFTITLYSFSSFALIKKAQHLYLKSKSPHKNAQIAQELAKSRYYFSAAVFAKEHLVSSNKTSPQFEELLEDLILKTGTLSFLGLSEPILRKWNSPSLNFILGLKLFNQKQYKKAAKLLRGFPQKHRFAPESVFILGSSQEISNDLGGALKSYQACQKLASDFENQSQNKKLKRYFAIIKESCVIHSARVHFKNRKYKKAIEVYEEIPKTSYRWPYILLEKAWAHYHLGDYNRTLGLLVTYKSPLMKSYFFPEAEVLSSLSYFRLCLWNDSLLKVEQYYKIYRPHSEALKKLLIPHKRSHTHFLKMMMKPIAELEDQNIYIRNLITQIRKKVKFSLDLVNYKKIQNELKYLKKHKPTQFFVKLRTAVEGSASLRTKHLNHYIKRQMFTFINDIHKFSYEMFNIKLEVMALERELVYTNKKLISDRSRGSLDNVNRTSEEHFYTFKGAFWADELGDYSFGLKSNCKRVRQKKKKGQVSKRR